MANKKKKKRASDNHRNVYLITCDHIHHDIYVYIYFFLTKWFFFCTFCVFLIIILALLIALRFK